MKIQTYFDVYSDGKVEYFQKDKFKSLIKNLKPGRYINKIEKLEDKRSLEQNNTYWGICYAYFERALVEAGILDGSANNAYLLKKTHEWCLHHFAPEDFVTRIREEWENDPGITDIKTGEIFKEPFRISSTLMTRKEGAKYFENMQDGYKEFFSIGDGDEIPNPDPIKKKN
jgi:hypothetical protein